MIIKKEANQYYSRYIERGVSDLSYNKNIVNYENYPFSINEIKTMNEDITKIVAYINKSNINYIGNHTANANGDWEINNTIIELKYTSGNNGTYFNTSTEYIKLLGFIGYSQFLKNAGYYSYLKTLGLEVNDNNVSPVSIAVSKKVRYSKENIYAEIKEQEARYRDTYMQLLYQFLLDNPNKCLKFIYDMITKEASGKSMPDKIIIFNHETKNIREISKQSLLNIINNKSILRSGSTITINNVKFTFAWQNGTGLNNPTIRVFLEV